MSLNERIELLFESGQVDRDIYEGTPGTLRQVEAFIGVHLDEDNAGSFTSHWMKAVQRLKTNQAVQECSPALAQQAQANMRIYTFSLALLAPFNKHDVELDAEAAFIASYLLTLTDEEEA